MSPNDNNNNSYNNGTTATVRDLSTKASGRFSINNYDERDQSYRHNIESNNEMGHQVTNGQTSVPNNGNSNGKNSNHHSANGKGKRSLFTSKKGPSMMRQRSGSLPNSTDAARHESEFRTADDHFYDNQDGQTLINEEKRTKRSNIMSSLSDIYNYVKPKSNTYKRKDHEGNHRETSFIENS